MTGLPRVTIECGGEWSRTRLTCGPRWFTGMRSDWRALLTVLLLLLGGVFVSPATGQVPAATKPGNGAEDRTAPLRFRRVYAPSDRPESWPRQQMPYFPMQPAEFERLLGQARTPLQMGGASVSVAIASARYKARLVGEDLVDGEGTLDVLHSTDHRAILRLAPCGLAISRAEWAGEESQPAELGQGADGQLGVLVERPGNLQLAWSLRGTRDAHGVLELPLAFPHSPSTQLIVELPETLTPLSDRGIVTQEAANVEQTKHWRIELGGHDRVRLRIVPTAELALRRHQTRVRQSLVYDLTSHGLELSAQLRFDVSDEPLRQILVELDPGLRLVTARYGSVAVPWSPMAPAADRAGTRVVLELPEPLAGVGQTVRLGLLAPLQLDTPWRLPGIRAEGVFWQEGNATLVVASPLLLSHLTLLKSRQTKVSALAAPATGESLELQCFAPDAGAEIVLSRPQASLELNCGTAVELGGGEMTARVVADLAVADGEVFEVNAAAARQWIIDSVESVPSEALGDWNVERSVDAPPKLTIRLDKPLSPSRPIRLQITGRRLQSPLGRWQGVSELVPLQFQASSSGKRLVTLRSVEPYQLKTKGTERLAIVDPQTLDPAAARLLNGSTGPLLFEQTAGAEDLRVSVERQSPQYAATIRVEAKVLADSLVESYRLSCIPAAAPIDRLLVRFSHRRSVPFEWVLVTGGEEVLNVRPFSGADSPTDGEEEDEAWEIMLPQPKSVPFEIRATRKNPLTKEQPVSLASLPEASSQRATLVVSAVEASVVRVEGGQLEPIPIEAVPADQYTNVRATYRYVSPQNNAAMPEATLTVLPRVSTPSLPMAWSWNCELESRYDPAGTGHHRALYRLQNAGRRQLQVTLPAGAGLKDLRGVWVDGIRVSWQAKGPVESRRLLVDLPAGRRFPVVAIYFTTVDDPLRLISRRKPARPELDVPVLACQWTAWLPPGYEAAASDLHWQRRRPPELTWTQRLFGPLGRNAASAPFDPFRLRDWHDLLGVRSTRQAAMNKARRVLQSLGGGDVNPRTKEAEGLDWRTMLTAPGVEAILADQSEGQDKIALLVDTQALGRLGLAPSAPLSRQTSGTATTRGAALFQQAGLTLLVHPAALVITSELGAALERDSLEPVDYGTTWWIRPGPLADRVEQALAGQEATLVRPAAWKDPPLAVAPSWNVACSAGLQPSDTRGWNAYQLEMSGTRGVSLTVCHRDAMRALRWTLFLLVTALACWRPLRRSRVLVPIAGLAALAALLLPAMFGPMASGVFLGILFSVMFGLRSHEAEVSPASEEPLPATPSASCTTQRAVSGMLVWLPVLLSLAFSGGAMAAEPARGEISPPPRPSMPSAVSTTAPVMPTPGALEAKPLPPAYHVLIPVDKDAKPTGEPYQVPEILYKELHRRAAAGTDEPQGWLLTRAIYRGTLVWQGPAEHLVPGELRASFGLEVFNPQTQVRLGLGRQGLNLVPDGATLDGRVIQPEWQEDGTVLAFEVAEPGPYQLELVLRPAFPNGVASGGFEFSIPRQISAQLDLTIPPNAPAIEIPSARGVVVRETDPPRVLAELGPSDRLQVRWLEPTAVVPVGPAVDLEELLWLKVQPDGVVLDTHLRFRIIEGPVQELRLQTDPRLRLLPLQGDNAPAAEIETAPGQPQTIRLRFPRPVSDQVELAASFLLTETSGIGNLRLPHMEVEGVRRTKRWLAVWVDPALTYGQQGTERLEAIAVPVFSAAWGPALVDPLSVYDLGTGEVPWRLATRPRDSRTEASESLALSVDQQEVQVQLDAQLNTTSGYRFQYRIVAPSALEVAKISLQAENLERVARWSRASDGTITVFLNAPTAGQQRLSLQGRFPVEKGGLLTLPTLRIDGVETSNQTVQLFRKSSVLVRVVEAQGLAEVASPVGEENTAPLGRLVKSFGAKGKTLVQLKVAVTANRPKVRAVQRTSVRFDGEQRAARVDFLIQVNEGLVDQWRLEVPSQWSGPYEVDPPSTVKVVTIPGDSRRRLVIQPNATVSGEYHLQVSGPLTLTPGERVCAPGVVLEGAHVTRHLLVLPTQWQLHPVVWETQGLKPTPLPDDLDVKPVGRESFVAYQVEHPSFQAVLKPVIGQPQVFLADVSLTWEADGGCRGVALFDLQSAGSAVGWLRLPEGLELVQVTVAGVPATAVRDTDQRWQLPLSPSEFPQRLEVLFRGRLAIASPNGACRIAAPTLDGLPVRQTIWTIAGPPFCQPGVPEGLTSVSRLEQELIRLRNVNALIEQATETTTESPEQTVQWYRTWARRWLDLGNEIRRQLALPAVPETSQAQTERQMASQELESLSGPQSPVASRLAGAQVVAQVATDAPPLGCPHRLWLGGLDGSSTVFRGVSPGNVGQLLLDCRSTTAGERLPRLSGVLLLMVLILVTVWELRRGRLRLLLHRYPHTAGVLFGLAWWWWLWPSVFGGVIVLASLMTGLHPNWRRSRKTASGVVNISSRKR